MQNEIYEALENHPDFSIPKHTFLTLDEKRRISARQALAQKSIEQFTMTHVIQNLRRPTAATRIMMQLATDSTIKFVVGDRLFTNAIMSMGTDRHAKYLDDAETGKVRH